MHRPSRHGRAASARPRSATRTTLLSLGAIAVATACASSAQRPAASPAPASAAPRATTTGGAAQPDASIAARTAGMEKRDGFLPLYLDHAQGKLYVEIPRDSMEVLYYLAQATGLGSNPIGIDRGADGPSYVARFDRDGDRVLVVLENTSYRSSLSKRNARTVAESFPPSTIAALPLLAVEDGRMLVDFTQFALTDWLDVAGTLAASRQGSYQVARDRSSIYAPYTKAFPENTEIDASLTFATAGRPGRTVEQIVPDGRAFTLRQHLSFVKLPDDGYEPRRMDPRVGFFGVTYKDYGQPIQLPLDVRLIGRHRLERVNPSDPHSPIRNPIVYYIDPGIPEPIRTATKQGVSWWAQAFDAAGLEGAFVVRDLPDSIDPMDSRYNVVQWENRNERGWSVGGSVSDPRTGEIIKGMARLDSHRARTDYNIYAALMGAADAAADTAFVLGRVRQVSAHEVGHTLGLAHNFIASTYGRGSVMDYPPPRVTVDGNGNIDISQAYASGPGAYDVWAIRWAYGIFPKATEQDSLNAIVREGLRKGYLFLSDADARPEYGSDPRVHLWDDAATAEEFLQHQDAVRRVAMSRFGLRNIRPGEPVATLEERFAPLYFFDRFAISTLARTIGGVEYANAVAGDGQQETQPIDGARQRHALSMLIGTLRPEELAIPDTVLRLLGPRPFGYRGSVEMFGRRTEPQFDELGAARTLAQMTVDLVLEPNRAARLVQQAADARGALSLSETIDSLVRGTWSAATPASPKLAALQRVSQRAVGDGLLHLAADTTASPEARAIAELKIRDLQPVAARRARSGSDAERAHWLAIAGDFQRWIDRRELPAPTPAMVAPPGDPFGE